MISKISELFKSKTIDPREIIYNVATKHHLMIEDLTGHSRRSHIVKARHTAMYEIRKQCELSLGSIGDLFNKDHTTVLHAIRKRARLVPKFKGVE